MRERKMFFPPALRLAAVAIALSAAALALPLPVFAVLDRAAGHSIAVQQDAEALSPAGRSCAAARELYCWRMTWQNTSRTMVEPDSAPASTAPTLAAVQQLQAAGVLPASMADVLLSAMQQTDSCTTYTDDTGQSEYVFTSDENHVTLTLTASGLPVGFTVEQCSFADSALDEIADAYAAFLGGDHRLGNAAPAAARALRGTLQRQCPALPLRGPQRARAAGVGSIALPAGCRRLPRGCYAIKEVCPMKKTFNQTMPCAVRLAALLLVPAVCVAFSGCSAVPGSSGSSAAEPSPSPAAAEPAAKPDLLSLRPLYQGDENGYYTFMTAASGDYQQVLYADYQTGTQAPACHITGCTHDSPSCPACFFTGVPVTLPCPVGDGTYLSFVYGYDSDGMSIVRLNQDYGVEQVLYHCNYISSFYCYTDGSSLWFSTCPSGDSYDRIKRLDLSTGGITTLFDAGDTSGQSANIIGCAGRQLVVSVSPYYDSSEPQTSCLYLVDADTGAAELLREYPITNASAGRTTNISTAVLDDTLYEYDYTTGELTATGLADRQTRTVTDALPPDPYEGRGAFDVTITRILNGQLVVEYYSNDWTDDNAETKTPVYLVDLAAGTVAEKPALPPLNWNGYDHTSTTILAQLQDRLLVLCRAEPYTRTTTGTDGAPYTIQSSHRYFGLISYADYLTGTPNYTEVGMLD